MPRLIPSTSLASIPLFLHRHVQLPPPSSIQSLPLLFGFLVRPSSVSTSISILSHMPSSNISLASLCNVFLTWVQHQDCLSPGLSDGVNLGYVFSIIFLFDSLFCLLFYSISIQQHSRHKYMCTCRSPVCFFHHIYIYWFLILPLQRSGINGIQQHSRPTNHKYMCACQSLVCFFHHFFLVPYSAFTAQRH